MLSNIGENIVISRFNFQVKLIPGKEKFETTTKNESWPQWNEGFTFHLRKETKQKFGKSKVVEEEINGSRFIVATLYAVLEDKPLIATEKKDADKEKTSPTKGDPQKKGGKKKEGQSGSTENQESTKNKLLNQFFGKGSDKLAESTTTERRAYDKRRTIGATTIPLDPKNFACKPPKSKHASDVSTGDLWKPLRPIASNISGAEERVSFCNFIKSHSNYIQYFSSFSFHFRQRYNVTLHILLKVWMCIYFLKILIPFFAICCVLFAVFFTSI